MKPEKTPSLAWSPPEWTCNCFPLPEEGAEILRMEWLVATLQAHIDTITEWDSVALGQALHVGHMLKTMQGPDGKWAAVFNARTGETIGTERSVAPLPMFQRMNALLNSMEFDSALDYAEQQGIPLISASALPESGAGAGG